MNRLKMSTLPCFVATLLTLLQLASVKVEATGPRCGIWNVVSTPSTGLNYYANLNGVAAISNHDAWAVGTQARGSYQTALIEHWNGTNWHIVSSPTIGTQITLTGVAAASTRDVWAVGTDYTNGITQTLIEHWNGSHWSIVASPYTIPSGVTLTGVAVVSAKDVWAVGADYPQPLIEHWNGSHWSIIASPIIRQIASLAGVAAISAKDVWAVGNYSTTSTNTPQRLIEHWNGSHWSIVASPPTDSTKGSTLNGVTAISGNNIWAVGYNTNSIWYNIPMIEHWNGSHWSIIASPYTGTTDEDTLTGVVAISTDDIWAVGQIQYTIQIRGGMSVDHSKPLIEHWNGINWGIVTNPTLGTDSRLYATAAVSAHGIWAVGGTNYDNGISQGITEFFC